jgi:hypothetical protein
MSQPPTKRFRRQGIAAAAGAVLFGLGLREAVRLRDADLESARGRARQLGATRVLAGIVILVRPQLLTAALDLSAAGEAGRWLSRMLAVTRNRGRNRDRCCLTPGRRSVALANDGIGNRRS